jgi:hypothetical protein
MALRVKRLLYDEGYTIPGARQLIKSELRHKEPQLPLIGVGVPDAKQLHGLRRELEAIAAILSHPVGKAPIPAIHPIRSQKRAASRSAALATPPGIPFDNPAVPKADRK